MLKQILADARETYFEFRAMGMDADEAVHQASSAMLDKLQLRLPWAMTLYMDYRNEINAYTSDGIPVNSVNHMGTPEETFLYVLARCLDRMFIDHLERDEPDEQVVLFNITDNNIEILEWDS